MDFSRESFPPMNGEKPEPVRTPPRRPKGVSWNESQRGREWLEDDEVRRIRKAAAKIGRHGDRDSTMILIAYRHGLRVSELVSLRWDQVNLEERWIYIRRVKRSKSGRHTMEKDEIGALRKLDPDHIGHVFMGERGEPLTPSTFFKLLRRAAAEAKVNIKVYPHMLRHACGYALGNKDVPTRLIQDWLGHINIHHTVKYTEMNPDRFRKAGIWSWRAHT